MAFSRTLAIGISIVPISAFLFVGFQVIRSPLFLVQKIVVEQDSQVLTKADVVRLSEVRLGKSNLFGLELRKIERNIRTHPWIREVELEKRFPNTLWIAPIYKIPKALFVKADGGLAYLDSFGEIFGKLKMSTDSNLPILLGFPADSTQTGFLLGQALELINQWETLPLNQVATLSSLSWSLEAGFRAALSYDIPSNGSVIKKGRAIIEFGDDFTGNENTSTLQRLSTVLQYLKRHSILIRQIWADSGKKIVVRTAYDS